MNLIWAPRMTHKMVSIGEWTGNQVDVVWQLLSCKEVTKYLPWHLETRAEAEEWCRESKGGEIKPILLDDQVVGFIGVVDQEIGYVLDPSAWGKGIASAAVKLILPTVDQAIAYVHPENIASQRVLAKYFTLVGPVTHRNQERLLYKAI